MRRIALCLLIIMALSLASVQALARGAAMIFWYPGEAGSTEEAQPVLDDFLGYVSQKMGDVQIEGRYYNTVDAGLKFISEKRPAIGIVSYAALTQYADKLGAPSVFLATLPLPGGAATEKYAIVGRSKDLKPGVKILSSEPMKLSYVREKLFAGLPQDAVMTPTSQIFSALKKISSGEMDAVAILTPIEASTLAQVSAEWARGLVQISVSENVPTARVLLFDPAWKDADRLRQVLIGAGSDPAAKDLLLELRLKGFAEAR